MSTYRATADRPDQAKAIAAVVAVHAALAVIILTGLNVRMVRQVVERLKTFDSPATRLPRPRPPPRPKPEQAKRGGRRAREEGRADAGRRAAAADPRPVPIPAAKIAGAGSASSSGRRDVGHGDGRRRFGQRPRRRRVVGGFTPAQKDHPRSPTRNIAGWSRSADGPRHGRRRRSHVTRIGSRRIAGSFVQSGESRQSDALMCQLTERYIRFRPGPRPERPGGRSGHHLVPQLVPVMRLYFGDIFR